MHRGRLVLWLATVVMFSGLTPAGGQELRTVEAPGAGVRLSFTPDGKMLVSKARTRIDVLDPQTLTTRATITAPAEKRVIDALLASADLGKVAHLDRTGGLCYWTGNDWTAPLAPARNWPAVERTVLSPDGTKLAATYRNAGVATLYLADLKRGSARILRRGAVAYHLAFSTDGKTLATWGAGTARKPAGRFKPGETRPAAAAPGGILQLFDVGTGRTRWTGKMDVPLAMVFTQDGKVFAAVDQGGRVAFWDVATGKAGKVWKEKLLGLAALAFSPDGKLLAGGGDKVIRLWNRETGEEIAALAGHARKVTSLTFSPDGTVLASTDGLAIKTWDLGKVVKK